jgi:RimJ/RimL family protein N-acetyltransferase
MAERIFSSPTGRQYVVRDLRPEDADLLVDLFYHLSPETVYRRFHAALHNLPEERVRHLVDGLVKLDPQNQIALIALQVGEEAAQPTQAVGVARCHRISGTTDAESAIVIRDDHQKGGLGTFLLDCLRDRALALGITHLIAIVQAQNHPILKVIQRSGLASHWRFEQGESYLAVDIRPHTPD